MRFFIIPYLYFFNIHSWKVLCRILFIKIDIFILYRDDNSIN